MTLDDSTILTLIGTMGSLVVGLAGTLYAVQVKRNADCERRHRRCEARNDALQAQVDALTEGDVLRAKAARWSDQHPTQGGGKGPRHPTPKPPVQRRGAGRLLRMVGFALLLAVIAVFTGCMETRSTADSAEVEHRRGVERGADTDLVITRERREQGGSHSGLDPAAVAALVRQAVQAVVPGAAEVAAAVKAAVPVPPAPPSIDAIASAMKAAAPPPASPDHTGELTGGVLAAGGALLAWLKAREARTHQQDAAEGWAKAESNAQRAERYARQLPPEPSSPDPAHA